MLSYRNDLNSLIVFLIFFFEKLDFGKHQQATKVLVKIPSMQRVVMVKYQQYE